MYTPAFSTVLVAAPREHELQIREHEPQRRRPIFVAIKREGHLLAGIFVATGGVGEVGVDASS